MIRGIPNAQECQKKGSELRLLAMLLERVVHELGSEHGHVGGRNTSFGVEGNARHHGRRDKDELRGSSLRNLNNFLFVSEAALDGRRQITFLLVAGHGDHLGVGDLLLLLLAGTAALDNAVSDDQEGEDNVHENTNEGNAEVDGHSGLSGSMVSIEGLLRVLAEHRVADLLGYKGRKGTKELGQEKHERAAGTGVPKSRERQEWPSPARLVKRCRFQPSNKLIEAQICRI